MKGFTRYYRDPAFRAEVDAQLALGASVPKGAWITYAIHDPTRSDSLEGRPEGLIVYVGQTKQFSIRVKDRLSSAGKAVRRPTDRIDGLLYDIIARGTAPRWSILEEVGTAIDSLVSETNWTIRLRARGHPLVNQWVEHRLGTLEIDRYAVDAKRLWPLTAADALQSNVEVAIGDAVTGENVLVDLTTLPPNTRLQVLKAHAAAAGRRARILVR